MCTDLRVVVALADMTCPIIADARSPPAVVCCVVWSLLVGLEIYNKKKRRDIEDTRRHDEHNDMRFSICMYFICNIVCWDCVEIQNTRSVTTQRLNTKRTATGANAQSNAWT